MTNCSQWLMFIHKIPAEPSGTRVSIWRKLKSYGSVSLQNSVWVLPDNEDNVKFFSELKIEIEHGSGHAYIFRAELIQSQESVIELFMKDRNDEYQEFIERCKGFLEEIKKETAAEKFTYAELEEIEVDLQKLTKWMEKINSRDFFDSPMRQDAKSMFGQCQTAFKEYSDSVYQAEGLESKQE